MSNPHELLGAYCTDALDPDERAAFEAHLARCADCRTEATQFREVLAALADSAPVQPPPELDGHILTHAVTSARPARTRPPAVGEPGSSGPHDTQPGWQPAEAERRHRPRRSRRRTRVVAYLASAAAGAVLFAAGVGVGWSQGRTNPPTTAASQMADIVAVASAGDASVRSVELMGTTSRVVTSQEMGKSVFLASALPTPARGMCYQIWRVTDDGRLISAGAFTPDPDGHIAAVLDGDAAAATKFLITLEPPGGSDHPTGPALGEVAT